MKNCQACKNPGQYWNSRCNKCGYYQHSVMSGKMYNILKVKGNAEKVYSAIIDNKQVELIDIYGTKYRIH